MAQLWLPPMGPAINVLHDEPRVDLNAIARNFRKGAHFDFDKDL